MRPTNILTYAMDTVINAIHSAATDEDDEGFLRAELDGELLFDASGEAPEEVKQLAEYKTAMRILEHCEYDRAGG